MPQLVEFVSEAAVGPSAGVDDRPRRLDLNPDGTYLASWASDGTLQHLQIVQQDGTPVGPVITLSAEGNVYYPIGLQAVLLSDGTIGVSFAYYAGYYTIKFVRFDAEGTQIGSPQVVGGDTLHHDIAALPGGGAVILSSNGYDLSAHVLDSTYSPTTSSFPIGRLSRSTPTRRGSPRCLMETWWWCGTTTRILRAS